MWHAYKNPYTIEHAIYAREDGTEVEISAVLQEPIPEPLPQGFVYLGVVERYVRGRVRHNFNSIQEETPRFRRLSQK